MKCLKKALFSFFVLLLILAFSSCGEGGYVNDENNIPPVGDDNQSNDDENNQQGNEDDKADVIINNDFDRIKYNILTYNSSSYKNASEGLRLCLDNKVKSASDKLNKITSDLNSYLFGHSMTKTDHMNTIYGNILKIAQGYIIEGSPYYKNEDVLNTIKALLTYMENNYYSHRYEGLFIENDNWYHWAINIPRMLLTTLIYIEDDLSENEISNYLVSVKRYILDSGGYDTQTMANQAEWGMNLILYGAFTNNDKLISDTYKSLSKIFETSSFGDGYKEDGSFIQHNYYSYTGAYGGVLIYTVAKISLAVANTKYQDDIYDNMLYDVILKSYLPLMYEGKIQTMTCGRHAYKNMQKVDTGLNIAQALAIMASYLPKEKSDYFKSYLNSFCYQNIDGLIAASADSFLIESLDKYTNFEKIKLDNYTKCYNGMNKVCGYYDSIGYGISMSSDYIAKYEAINGDNPKGWYQGDGATYIYTNKDNYDRNYWKMVDMYKLAGTTVTTAIREEATLSTSATLNFDSRYFGGVASGNNLATGMHLSGHCNYAFNTSLVADKGYFLSDGVLVCVGNNINCSDYGVNTLTIIENRRFYGDIYFGNNKLDLTIKSGSIKSNYIFIENYGTIYVSDISGLKYNITDNGFIEIYIDHGQNVSKGSYCYYLMPNINYNDAVNIVNDFNVINTGNEAIITRKSNSIFAVINYSGAVSLK